MHPYHFFKSFKLYLASGIKKWDYELFKPAYDPSKLNNIYLKLRELFEDGVYFTVEEELCRNNMICLKPVFYGEHILDQEKKTMVKIKIQSSYIIFSEQEIGNSNEINLSLKIELYDCWLDQSLLFQRTSAYLKDFLINMKD